MAVGEKFLQPFIRKTNHAPREGRFQFGLLLKGGKFVILREKIGLLLLPLFFRASRFAKTNMPIPLVQNKTLKIFCAGILCALKIRLFNIISLLLFFSSL